MALGLSQAEEEIPWEKTLFKGDVVVYKVPDSAFREFLAEGVMKGSIEKFKALLRDPDLQPEWLPNCMETALIESKSPDDFTYHMKLNVPFPFENRDLVQRLVFSEEEGYLEVAIINRTELVPEQKGLVRMPQIGGSWRVRELGGDMINPKFSPGFRNERLKYNLSRHGGKKISTFDEDALCTFMVTSQT